MSRSNRPVSLSIIADIAAIGAAIGTLIFVLGLFASERLSVQRELTEDSTLWSKFGLTFALRLILLGVVAFSINRDRWWSRVLIPIALPLSLAITVVGGVSLTTSRLATYAVGSAVLAAYVFLWPPVRHYYRERS